MALVLAIEPDLRQAAILKRIVKENVKADLIVVDSRDAALEAIGRGVPDVLLLTALMSPRDEDDLIQHLRSLDGADHLQTHTIPQLASSLEDRSSSKGGGLLKVFRRKKTPEPVASGCDPDLFADEIRTFVKYAAERKEERRALIETGQLAADAAARSSGPLSRDTAPRPAATSSSSWDDPFAWSTPAAPPAPEEAPAGDAVATEPDPWATDYRRAVPTSASEPPSESNTDEPVAIAATEHPEATPDTEADTDTLISTSVASVTDLSTPILSAAPSPASDLDLTHVGGGLSSEPEDRQEVTAIAQAAEDHQPEAVAESEVLAVDAGSDVDLTQPVGASDPGDSREVIAIAEAAEDPQSDAVAEGEGLAAGAGSDRDLTQPVGGSRSDAGVPRSLGPLATWVRFDVSASRPTEKTTTDELHDLMAHLSIPPQIAGVTYARGCRIRRVRVPGGRERRKGTVPGPVILSKRQLAEQRQTGA